MVTHCSGRNTILAAAAVFGLVDTAGATATQAVSVAAARRGSPLAPGDTFTP